MKRGINVFEHAGEILGAMRNGGMLLTTKLDDKVNTMTISWGTLGVEWLKSIFTVFVRENRFTKKLLDKTGEFTVSIPMGKFDRKILSFCGSTTGRDTDKIGTLGLTLEEPLVTSVPGIQELPLTLECRVTYKQAQDMGAIAEEDLKFYPQDVPGTVWGSNQDGHTAYYGEIVSAYIIE